MTGYLADWVDGSTVLQGTGLTAYPISGRASATRSWRRFSSTPFVCTAMPRLDPGPSAVRHNDRHSVCCTTRWAWKSVAQAAASVADRLRQRGGPTRRGRRALRVLTDRRERSPSGTRRPRPKAHRTGQAQEDSLIRPAIGWPSQKPTASMPVKIGVKNASERSAVGRKSQAN